MADRKTELVIDCRMINASGIGTYLKNIIPGLVASGSFSITVMGKKDELSQFEWFKKVSFIKLSAKILSLHEQLELPFKVPRCHIYWSPNINGPILHTKAKHRVTTIHDVYHLANPANVSPIKLAFIRFMINSGIRHSTNVITVSNFSRGEILKYVKCPEEKIRVFAEAVDDFFNQNYKFEKINERYILCVGNVKPHKNLQLAVKAFKELKLQGLKLYIVGKKEGFKTGDQDLLNSIENLGDSVVFTGFVSGDQLKNYYANAQLFLFPSKYEGFGLPVLEALKFNLPILASNASSIPEVGGDAIEYFQSDNLEDLKEKLGNMLTKPYEVSLSKYKQQLNKFSWKTTIQQHLKLFLSLK